ncbi:MAG: arabinogalactan endo,4-beta-galactosidase, partial [Streptomyces sp.]|nr:arabinogalactan endo,4-beta-galactosidase [Streptomyces sp.]
MSLLSRRRLLAAVPLLAAPVDLGCQAKGEPELAPIAMTSPAPPLRGVDLSSTLQAESAGQKYKDRGKSAPVERLLAARGANLMRLRVWVDASSGGYDL